MRPQTRPIKPLSKQEILDHVWQHFVVEGHSQSIDKYGDCCYDNSGCAIGCLLTTEDANAIPNGAVNDDTILSALQAFRYFDFYDPSMLWFLQQLQTAHDNSKNANFIHDFRPSLVRISQEFDLTIPQTES